MESNESHLPPLETFVMGLLQKRSPTIDKENVRLVVDPCYAFSGRKTQSTLKLVSLMPKDRWDNATSSKHRDKSPPSPTLSRWDSQACTIRTTKSLNKNVDSNQRLPPSPPKRKKSHVKMEVIFSERKLLDNAERQCVQRQSSQPKLTLPISLRTLPYATR
jgi:hypothetical protein